MYWIYRSLYQTGRSIPTTYTEILKSHLSDKEIVELIAFITFTNAQQQFGAMMKL